MYPWKTTFQLDSKSSEPKYLQLSDLFIKEITAGRLQSDQKLPGSRKLSELLRVNRKTIIRAYDELVAQGWLKNEKSSGTFISTHLPIPTAIPIVTNDSGFKKAKPTKVISHFNHIHLPSKNEASIKFDGGAPDARLAPLDWIYKECKSLTKANYGRPLLKYGSTEGEPQLIATLEKYLSETRGLNVNTKRILITRGSQMGIYLTFQTLIETGDIVIVGNSSYDAADWTAMQCGAKLSHIKVDENGMDTNELETFCKSNSVKVVYLTPHHHYPTTVTLTNERRVHLLQLASKYDFYILEDDYDYDFHYSSRPILPLASLDNEGRVIYIGSFSKIIAPSIRVGYTVSSSPIADEMSKIRYIIDRQGDHILQRAISESIKSGQLSRHLKKSLITYRKRRDHLTELLNHELSDYTDFNIPEGGMAVWTKFKNIKLDQLKPILEKLSLSMDIDRELSIKFNACRIGFASLNEQEMTSGIELLKKGVKQLAS